MNEPLHIVLRALAEEKGYDILSNPHLSGILYDMMGAGYDMRPLVECAAKSSLGARILDIVRGEGVGVGLRIATIKTNFQEDYFFRPQYADYIVDSFLYAIGELTELELPKMEDGTAGEPEFVGCEDGNYCGYSDNDGCRCGFGVLKDTPDRSYYAGYWRFGMRMGMGIGSREGWGRYAGFWHMNKPNGSGVLTIENGNVYSGLWKDGFLDGWATVYYPNGDAMVAHFVHGEMDERPGVFYFQDGSELHGRMSPHGPDGTCTRYLRDGSHVIEHWHNGRK